MSQIWRCNQCGLEINGTIEELTDAGWVRVEVDMGERRRATKATFHGCPDHVLAAAERAAEYVSQRLAVEQLKRGLLDGLRESERGGKA